jgi:nucleoside-diphosphate-sugar epimerase
MKVLVTGAPGWLGDNIVSEFIKKGNKVRCLVLPRLDSSKLKKWGAELVPGDVTKKETLKKAVQGVDIVIHAAGIIHPKKIKELYQVNYQGTKNVIDAAIEAKVKRFILISSNSPMGCNKRRDVLMKEDDPYNPYKNYGKSKMLAEKYVNQKFKEGKIETVVLRLCWFYGPNQPARQSKFFKMIKKGNPIVFGDGKNWRSMSYVENSVQGIYLAATKKDAAGQTYWIADEKPYQTIEIYKAIADLLGVELKPRHVPALASSVCEMFDDIFQAMGMYQQEIHVGGEMDKDIACSIQKAKKELGYSPKVSLKEGMKRSIEWCKENGIEI